MSLSSIMVVVDSTEAGRCRLDLAADLAGRSKALLIGIAARDLSYADLADATMTPVLIEQERTWANEELESAAMLFRDAAPRGGQTEWRSSVTQAVPYIAQQARAADLIVAGRAGQDHPFAVDPGDLLMTAGRPVLVTPPGVRQLSARQVVVAWKDTPEARRAVRDALPILRQAERVRVVSLGDIEAEVAVRDVAAYLAAHGVKAEPLVRNAGGATVAGALVDIAREGGADLIVGGAYGHSRLREWIFGGVTAELLAAAPVCCLFSH